MPVYTCVGFKGYWPTSTAAVVCAENEADARTYLLEALQRLNLSQDKELQVFEFNQKIGTVEILSNGEY